MTTYAEVAINAPVRATFDYHIPPHLEGLIAPGHLVQVAFGTAQQFGVVLALHDTSPIQTTKPIRERLDPRPVLTPQQISLARWLSATTFAPPGDCVWLFLPPGFTGQRDMQVTLVADSHRDDLTEQKLIHLLQRRGMLTGRQIHRSMGGEEDWHKALERLAKAGVVTIERVLAAPRTRPKLIQTAGLAIHPNQIPHVARHLGRDSRQADILEVLAALPADRPTVAIVLDTAEASRGPLDKLAAAGLVTIHRDTRPHTVSLAVPREAVPETLLDLRDGHKQLHILQVLARESEPIDVSWIDAQTGATLNDLKQLEEDGLIFLAEKQTWRDSLAERDFVPTVAPPLTPEQAAAWEQVSAAIKGWMWEDVPHVEPGKNPNYFLLHGVTGSGKTEIYLRAIELTLAQGRQAIFLVPEIALTPQTVRRVAARFPGQVAVVHSGLSDGERYDTWRRAREGLISVVVGARSALFTPLPDVGLVILDEEHDHSYKQSPPIGMPYYHARAAAEEMMRQNHGVLLLGSATPDVETMHRAIWEDMQLIRLPSRIMGHRERILEQSEREGVAARYHPTDASDALMIDLPPVDVVDMRDELRAGNTSIFSRALQTALGDVLAKREQAILYLNRRGTSTYVFCRDCGYVATCPRCDTPLTYHRHDTALHCHRCDYQTPPPSICPQCGSKRIKFFGAGTQQVEQAITEMFPGVRVLRWDADTATNAAAHEAYLQRFMERGADVLIGTQMVAKGLDLPLVTLVGVVSADMGLALPDFRAGERVFQLLTQVAGRAGRGLRGGKVVLQTYQPGHYAVAAASAHDYNTFYGREIAYRRDMGYPPFRSLIRVLFRFPSDAQAKSEAERCATILQGRIAKLDMTGTEMIGPAPCFFNRINDVYHWHLFLRGPNPAAAFQGIDIPRGWYVDIDPVEVL
ncbi:MAG: primosomal protein N' [Anaerolineaceae bacterium]|nr:primosomal protein N' [Anaerolineaceae bacterium]